MSNRMMKVQQYIIQTFPLLHVDNRGAGVKKYSVMVRPHKPLSN